MKELLFIIIILFLYFLPFIIGRNRKDYLRILILNLFLGWTFLGWVAALIWAVGNEDK
jgi:RsiW-degrading membrane proteinase PrsW (M82 family)